MSIQSGSDEVCVWRKDIGSPINELGSGRADQLFQLQ